MAATARPQRTHVELYSVKVSGRPSAVVASAWTYSYLNSVSQMFSLAALRAGAWSPLLAQHRQLL